MSPCIANCTSNSTTNQFCLETNQTQVRITNSLCRLAKPFNWVALKTSKINDPPKKNQYNEEEKDTTWLNIQQEAISDIQQEPILKDYYYKTILSHVSLESSLANILATKLCASNISRTTLFEIFFTAMTLDTSIGTAVRSDLRAARERDPACLSHAHCLLNFKGFQATQAHRVAHELWSRNRTAMAVLIQSRVSEVFGVDIHPGARIGSGVVIDHATGVVIGETSVVGDDVTILHGVTLGGTGKVVGDRHPKIGDGVFVGAGSMVLGNVVIGNGAKIGAGSVLLKEVPANATAVGNPARLIGR